VTLARREVGPMNADGQQSGLGAPPVTPPSPVTAAANSPLGRNGGFAGRHMFLFVVPASPQAALVPFN